MSAPTIPTLGASTNNRQWIYEFNTGTSGAPVWTTVGGVTNSQFQPSTGNWVDNTDQSGKGAQSSNKSGYTWSGDLTLERKVTEADPTKYDPGQEHLRLASLKIGTANTVEMRVCEYDPNDPTGTSSPRVEAYHGFAGVDWVPDGGDMMADNTVKVSLKGQGALDEITHPYPAGAAVPTVSSVSPASLAVAGGTLVQIDGNRFTGTTAVSIAGTAATSYTVVSDTVIVAVAPAHSAGSGLPVVVTNASGASSGGATVAYA